MSAAGEGSRPGLRRFALTRIAGAARELSADWVIDETAVALSYNGTTHAVMMATAADLEDFARGYSLTEGIVGREDAWRLLAVERHADGVVLEMAIDETRFAALQSRRRRLAGNSACGLCGSESLQAVSRAVGPVAVELRVEASSVARAMADLVAGQALNRASGGVHAAGFQSGGATVVREDVGRHNALDKLVGALDGARRTEAGVLVLSSRASHELVHKAAAAGLPVMATVSAPTSAAIALAESAGITLVGFVRGATMNVYTHARRILDAPDGAG